MPAWLKDFVGDRIQINSVLIVLCFVSVLTLSSQSAASYPSYLLALSMLLSVRSWNDVFAVPLVWPVMALVGYLCLSAFWSDPFRVREMLGILGRGLLVLLFVVALAESQLRGQVQRWLGRALAVVGMSASGVALAVYWNDAPHDSRLSGLGQLDNPVVFGLILGAVLITLAHLMLSDSSRVWRLIASMGAMMVFYAILLSGSRNALVSCLLGLAVLGLSTIIRDTQRFTAAAIALMIVALALLLAFAAEDVTREILFPRGDSYRLEIWENVFHRVVSEAPLFGFGITTPDVVHLNGMQFSHPHNMYLAVFFQGGFVGVCLFFLLISSVMIALIRSYQAPAAKLSMGLLAMALTSYLLDGHELVDKVGETWFLLWLPVGIAMGLAWSAPKSSALSSVEP